MLVRKWSLAFDAKVSPCPNAIVSPVAASKEQTSQGYFACSIEHTKLFLKVFPIFLAPVSLQIHFFYKRHLK